jgi:tRNA-(ms[2]io[6]A)-hydroxylase
MARLAREESAHLAKVLRVLESRGLSLSRDEGDPYAQALHALVRRPSAERRLDKLLVAAIIEARSFERLSLLAGGLADPELKDLYRDLAHSEDGHQSLFLRFAAAASDATTANARLDALVQREAAILRSVGIRAAIH